MCSNSILVTTYLNNIFSKSFTLFLSTNSEKLKRPKDSIKFVYLAHNQPEINCKYTLANSNNNLVI